MFEFLFKYSPTVFEDGELILANGWPLWLMGLLGVVAAAALIAALLWRGRRLRAGQLAALGVLQLLIVAVALLLLWQPAVVTERLVSGENAVAVMLDTSSSMATIENGATRMVRAQALLTDDSLREIAEIYEVLPYGFSEEAQRLPSFAQENIPAPGPATNIGRSLLQALRESSSASLGAVILLSDGADNGGIVSQAQLNEIAAYGVPIHTVGIGREQMPEDLELSEVVLPPKALPGTTLSARVNIRHDQGGTARVKVYDGDTFLSNHDVQLDPGRNMTMAYIDIEVAEPGQMDLRFSLDPLPGERNLANNTRASVVDVPESQYRILYVEGEPRWEYKFMRRALEDDPSIRLTTLLRVTPNKFYRQGIDDPEQLADGFPTESRDLYRFDALILGSVEAAEFSEAQHEMIRDFVSERGGSLMLLAGLNGLGQGGWGETALNEILPARLSLDDTPLTRQKAPVALSSSGRLSPLLELSDNEEENLRLWAELPEVADYQGMGPLRPAATQLLGVIAGDRTLPLLVSQPYGRGQSYILASGGTWRWQMSLPVDDLRHETFWRQLARGLVANAPRPFELTTTVQDGEIQVRAEIRDPEAEENQDLSITAAVSGANNENLSLNLQPVPGQPGSYAGAFAPRANGLYAIEAISLRGDEPVDATRTAIRYEEGQEAFGVRQNRALLERLASATGGRYWTPEQWSQLPEAISYSNAGITERDIRYLWDAPFFFFLLALLKSGEWLLRRRWRTI